MKFFIITLILLKSSLLLAQSKKKIQVFTSQNCNSHIENIDELKLRRHISDKKVKKSWLKVSGGHTLYIEESGNPLGKPVIYLHGGPGIGASTTDRRHFNPKKYRIITFAQRGSPPSLYEDPLRENTTWHLIDDMEKIREFLGVDKWMLFGGSWGSTLALAYGIQYPERVTEMVLRGIYLARHSDNSSFKHLWQAPETAWPEWKEFHAFLNQHAKDGERSEQTFYRAMISSDEALSIRAKRVWMKYSESTAYDQITVSSEYTDEALKKDFSAVLETMYCSTNAFFPEENYILNNIDKIRHIPAIIIHGANDLITPLDAAVSLSQAWPIAKFMIIPGSGHVASNSAIKSALMNATRAFED